MGRRVFTCFKHGKACLYVLRGESIGKRVLMYVDKERIWERMSLRVLSMGRHVFTCHDEKRVWESVSSHVMMGNDYGKTCIYVF